MTKAQIQVLWKHYSSYPLYAIIAVGGLYQYVAGIPQLPTWLVATLAIVSLICKLIPQTQIIANMP